MQVLTVNDFINSEVYSLENKLCDDSKNSFLDEIKGAQDIRSTNYRFTVLYEILDRYTILSNF